MPATATTSSRRRPSRRAGRRRPIAPDDLRRFQLVSSPRFAPDGRRVVFEHKRVGEKNEYCTSLMMVDADGATPPRAFTAGPRDRHARWSPDGATIAFIRAAEKRRPQLWTIPADGGEARALTSLPEGSIGTFRWSPDGRRLAVSFRLTDAEWTEEAEKARKDAGASEPPRVLDHWWYRLDGDGYFNAQRYHLLLVDAQTGEHRTIYAKDTLGFFSFDFAPSSAELVVGTNRHRRAGLRPWNDELLRIDVETGAVTPIPGLPEGPKDAVAWSPDGAHIAYAGRIGEDPTYSVENLELFVCDPARGDARSLTGRTDYCLMSMPVTDTAEVSFSARVAWAPDGKRLFTTIGWHGEGHVASVSLRGDVRLLTDGPADRAFGDVAPDGRRVALTSATATSLAEIHVARLGRGPLEPTPLTDLNGPLLKELDLAPITSHWVTAEDGSRVQVWWMKPINHRTGRRAPAILEVHGGPHTQYGVGFFHEMQVLAANGYHVFFSNPRGSKGYGRDHCAAIRGRWGDRDWVDVQAVRDFMKDRAGVDPKRLGIMGGSYGGYMTNWAIAHTHDFAAAITDRCVSNVAALWSTSDFLEAPDSYFPGNCWDRPEAMWEQSPLKHFGNVRTPTLIIHSEGDLRCNVAQAEQVFAVLTLRRIPCRFVRYPRTTSHGLSRSGPPDLRIHRLEQILAWWAAHLRG